MTQSETRQLGIEFERRCQTVDPTMEYIGKMDTDDIYSFINQYVVEYVKAVYQSRDKVEKGTPEYSKIAIILDSITKNELWKIEEDSTLIDGGKYTVSPIDNSTKLNDILEILGIHQYKFQLYNGEYINSSIDLVSYEDLVNMRNALNQNFILKRPVMAIYPESNKLELELGSLYKLLSGDTVLNVLQMSVVKLPVKFGPKDTCPLPATCFDDIVTGAVQLYFSYKSRLTKPDKEEKQSEES